MYIDVPKRAHERRRKKEGDGMEPTKKMLIMYILEILQKYSDAQHTLSQKDIREKLWDDYGMDAERKAIKRNLQNLIDMGYDIEYNEVTRMTPNPKTGKMEENTVTSDYYLERDFTDAELRLLIDGLLFSSHIPYSQLKKLVSKLEGLSNKYFEAHVKHIHAVPHDQPQSPSLFYTIETLDDAISRKRKVTFAYGEYGTDKKLHKRLKEDGTVRQYVVSPYQMAARDGRYYLICNNDEFDNAANYRVDRIMDIRILRDEPIRPFRELTTSSGRKLDLAQYMDEHIYMWSSDTSRVRFRITKSRLNSVFDHFGKDVTFEKETEDEVEVSARVTEAAMLQFAKNYAPYVVVLEPASLVEEIKEDVRKTLKAYGE